MKTTVSKYDFERAFSDCGRESNFSYEALGLLFDYFEQYEEDCGEEVELDPIAICCEFSEDDWDDIADNYDIDLSDCEDDDEREQAVEDHLQDNTLFVGKTSGTMVYMSY